MRASLPAQLTGKQRRFLRSQAHSLRPVVAVGHAGLSQGVVDEVDLALQSHELIKVRLGRECGVTPEAVGAELLERIAAQTVQVIGHVLVLYRPDPDEPKFELPARGEP